MAAPLTATLPACTSLPPPDRTPPTRETLPSPTAATVAELRAAVATWHRTRATITYRTKRQRDGFPASVHQCLRALIGDDVGQVPRALRMCDPSGVVTLVWDPPTRWRLDVIEGGTTTTAIVTRRGGIMCERPDAAETTCRSRPIDKIVGDVPFHELIVAAARTTRSVGLSPVGPVTISLGVVAGVPVRCFERHSRSSEARWCFGDDGALLSIELEMDGLMPTIIEAARVSHEVDEERFDPSTTASGEP
jgi:hypothetical protein